MAENISKVLGFLDIAFSLNNGTYKSYRKTNDPQSYTNKSFDQPNQVIYKLPGIISKEIIKKLFNQVIV